MYKLLVLDMDGTLLDEKQEISKDNIMAIKKAVEKGVKVVLASGRPFDGIHYYLEQLELIHNENHTISCSGALISNNHSREVLHSVPISYEDLITMHNLTEQMDLDLSAYTKDRIMVHNDNLFSRYDAVLNHCLLEVVDYHDLKDDIEVVKLNLINEDISTVEELCSYFPTVKIDDMTVKERKNFNKNLLDELWRFPKEIIDRFTILKPLPFCLEILSKNCNKSVAVEKLAEVYNIKQEEIICIGDSGNDIHMIEYAGLGIAMGNAYEEVKAVADDVTLSNEESGVAHAINKYILS